MVTWTEKYLKVLYDYKIVRGEAVCSESFAFAEVSAPVATYVAAASKSHAVNQAFLAGTGKPPSSDELKELISAMKESRAAIEPKAPCLAQMLNRGGHSLFTEAALANTGTTHVSLHRFIVDIDKPGQRGTRLTERRDLAITRLVSGTETVGWRVFVEAARGRSERARA